RPSRSTTRTGSSNWCNSFGGTGLAAPRALRRPSIQDWDEARSLAVEGAQRSARPRRRSEVSAMFWEGIFWNYENARGEGVRAPDPPPGRPVVALEAGLP